MQCLRILAVCALACLLLASEARADCGDHKSGETWQTGPPDTCAQYTCHDGSIRGKTCPTYKVHSKCKRLPTPEGSVFPECCPRFECPEVLD